MAIIKKGQKFYARMGIGILVSQGDFVKLVMDYKKPDGSKHSIVLGRWPAYENLVFDTMRLSWEPEKEKEG